MNKLIPVVVLAIVIAQVHGQWTSQFSLSGQSGLLSGLSGLSSSLSGSSGLSSLSGLSSSPLFSSSSLLSNYRPTGSSIFSSGSRPSYSGLGSYKPQTSMSSGVSKSFVTVNGQRIPLFISQ